MYFEISDLNEILSLKLIKKMKILHSTGKDLTVAWLLNFTNLACGEHKILQAPATSQQNKVAISKISAKNEQRQIFNSSSDLQ